MSLVVWLPLINNIENQGTLSGLVITNNGAASATGGKLGNCYSFNGTSSRLYANGVSLSNSEMSTACWIKFTELATSSNQYPYIISLGGNSSVTGEYQQIGLSLWYNPATIHVCANGSELDTGFTPVVNTWYHFCFTYKGSVSKLYVNGALTYTGTNANSPQTRSCLCIGARSNDASGAGVGFKYPIKGYLNDVG